MSDPIDSPAPAFSSFLRPVLEIVQAKSISLIEPSSVEEYSF